MAKAKLGGAFIYANDHKNLADWYARVFGLNLQHDPDTGAFYHQFELRAHDDPSRTEAVVWAVLPREEQIPKGVRTVMFNFRVDDLDACLADLERDGIMPHKRQEYPYGRFAWITDPAGNPVEIYQDVSS